MAMLPDYPSPPGNKNISIVTVAGPASYTAVTNGSPPTGGQALTARDVGLPNGVEFIEACASDDGQYEVAVIFPSNPAKGASSVILRWVVSATGAEVSGTTDLSARKVRLKCWSR